MTPRGRTVNPGGWRATVSPPVKSPAVATPPAPPKSQKAHAPIPATLPRTATSWLACPFCKLPQLADSAGVLLWHRMEWRGEQVECTGTNTIGLPLEQVGGE